MARLNSAFDGDQAYWYLRWQLKTLAPLAKEMEASVAAGQRGDGYDGLGGGVVEGGDYTF
ncbi:hypothetical protein [Duganella sp. Dugasp56]|uniref:hypothetical protein n=1 Tax=Duganella sp. Dugasp56 TaxID=3243046 RepID=UPI0039AFAC83